MIPVELGVEPDPMGRPQLADDLVRERARWRALIKAMGHRSPGRDYGTLNMSDLREAHG